ncbi:hypothetical protein [Alicyclobacillus suci]|nr:hypothetical protein [Alicyclobacillus suci]
MEMDEKWQSGHKYLDMAEYVAWREEQQRKKAKVAKRVSQIG